MSAEREKRARLSHACDRCRKRHVKCDGDYPVCGNCKSVSGECCYSHPGSKRGYVETIDDRLNKIEQVLTKYFEGADAPQSKNLNNKTERVVNGPEMGVYDAVNMSKNLEKIDVVALSESMNSLTVKNNTRYFTINDDADKNATPENTGDAMTEIKEMAEFLTSEPPLPEVYKGSRELPEEDLINHLVDKYRRHGFASKAPLIHIPTFLKQLRDKHNPPSIFLLNSLMAVSSFYTDDERVLKSGNPETAGEIFFERAIGLLDDFMDRARMSSVQGLLLLTQFCVRSNEHSCRIWILLGMAVRMSMDLALNRDCSKWNISELEKAMRVRVFWSVMNAEIISCASFGKPLPVYDYNTPYPYPIEEDENPQEIVNYMHYSKLIHIYGNTLHSKPYFSHPASFRNTLPAVEAALRKWSLDLPQNLQFNLSAAGDPDPSTPFYTAFINQIYFAIIISLHRPYINSDQYPNIDSRKKCREAAINITKLSAYMNIKDRATLTIYITTMYCLSQAATIHLMDMNDPDFYTQGRTYMQRCLASFEKFARSCRVGDTNCCGVDDCLNMLQTLLKVQLEKAEEDGTTEKPLGSINRINELPKKVSENGSVDQVSALQPSIHHQEPVDETTITRPTIKLKKSPTFNSQIPTPSPTNNMISPSPRQLHPTPVGQSSYLTTLSQDFSSQSYKPNPTPAPSPFPQHHPQLQQHRVQPHSQIQHAYVNMTVPVVTLNSFRALAEPPIVPSSNYYFARQDPTQLYMEDWNMVDLAQHQIDDTDVDNSSFRKPPLSHSLVNSNGSNFASPFNPVQNSSYVSYPIDEYTHSNASTDHMEDGRINYN